MFWAAEIRELLSTIRRLSDVADQDIATRDPVSGSPIAPTPLKQNSQTLPRTGAIPERAGLRGLRMTNDALTLTETASILTHYERVAPLLAAHFAGTPLTAVFHPGGHDAPIVRVGQLHKPVPTHVRTIDVATRSGTHAYIALTENSLLWRVHTRAVGFESWTPTARDPLAVRFARLILALRGKATIAMLRDAARTVRAALNAHTVDAAPLVDGRSLALFIPFDDAPAYEPVRAWLHAIMADAARRAPLFECAPGVPPDRIHLSAQSDAPGHGSALPYTLNVQADLAFVVPIAWDELDAATSTAWTRDDAPDRLALGDVFATELARIGPQRCAALTARALAVGSPPPGVRASFALQPRSDVITVAFDILADGKPRSVDEILAEAIARDLLPRAERKKYVYATPKAYVEKMLARGLHPLIVQDPDRRFRSNHPADDLPDPAPAAPYVPPHDVVARLQSAAAGDDPTAFETAVLAAFEPLGFRATHVGCNANPDGYVDAILGVLRYRAMLECKLNAKPLVRPDIAEAAKFRDAYGAQHAIMVANCYAAEKETLDECRIHAVSLWTVADLLRLLQLGATPGAARTNAFELRPLFAPGLAADALADLEWSRIHGARKRLTVLCDLLLAAAWRAQADASVVTCRSTRPRTPCDPARPAEDPCGIANRREQRGDGVPDTFRRDRSTPGRDRTRLQKHGIVQ
jgi:DNA primase